MKIRPLANNVLVQRIEAEDKTSGGIVLPDTAKEKPKQGKVIAAGRGRVLDDGKLRPTCTKCGNSSEMVIEEKEDIIDELSDLAEKTGCKVELISLGSEEGDSLYSAFNGIAGILRYPVEI